MFTTGSKFFIGASVMAVLATVIYGVTQGGVLGTVGLASASISLIALTTADMILRDSNVFVDDEAPAETSSAAQLAPAGSPWPFGFALGAVIVAVGLISFQPVVVIGLVALLATGAEWVVAAWSERASSDADHNAVVRSRVSNPLEYPIGGAVAIGVIVYAFSRIMLWLSKTNTVVAFAVLAALVLIIGFAIAYRPSVKASAVGGIAVIGAVGVIAAGTAAGLDGERDIHVFETTGLWQNEAVLHPAEYAHGAEEGDHPAEPICSSPAEFPEADEDVSQTVSTKSNTTEILLRADGTLEYNLPGPDTGGPLTVARSNTTNVIFRNQYDDRARLSLDLGTMTVELSEGGETEQVDVRNQLCTTLIETDAAQVLTFEVGEPSVAFPEDNPHGDGPGFWFFVPGVETAKLEVVVP